MPKYYTRACNFCYGHKSKVLVKKKKTLPLHGNEKISFDCVELISRKYKKKIPLKKLSELPKVLKKKIRVDLKNITKKKKNFANLNFLKLPNIMGVLNLTPDSFSDGGKYNSINKGTKHAIQMFKSGANIIDVGGESTRPGSKVTNANQEWNRINKILKLICKKVPVSLDTRKSKIMEKGIKFGVKIINDVSGLNYDLETKSVLKKYKIPFIIQHTQGTPENMQINPSYKNELLEIYDFFEQKINFLRKIGIKHSNIIIDPGIGFGKDSNHNLEILETISIFRSLGC